MIGNLLIFIIALLPVVILGCYIYSKDNEKEPIKMIIRLFIGGILSALVSVCFSFEFNLIFGKMIETNKTTFFSAFFYTFVGVSFIEEVSKFLMTFLFSYNSKEYDQFYDMIVYSAFISLGFAWIENMFYSYDGGLQVALLRGLLSVPAHVSVSVFMGYYLSLSKIAKNNKQKALKIRYILLSIFIPTFLHGIYDFLIYYNNYVCIYFYYLFVIILYRRAYLKVKVSSLMHQNLVNSYLLSNHMNYKSNGKY